MEGLGSETTSCPIRWPSWCSKERASWFVSRRVGRWCESHKTSATQSACLALGLMNQSMGTTAFCTRQAMKASSGRYHNGSCWKVEPT